MIILTTQVRSITSPMCAIGREGGIQARAVFFDQRSRFICFVLFAIAIAAIFSAPAFGEFALTDIGCSQAPLAGGISAPAEALAGQPVIVNYTVSGISLQPTGEVCGECVRQEEYCAQTERYACNCRRETKKCNCRQEQYECNCRTEQKACNCRKVCSAYGQYECGSYYDSCCAKASYQYRCCRYRVLGLCVWWGTCTSYKCVGCRKPQYCSGCVSYKQVCDTCTYRVCDTCERTVCDTCSYNVCDTCEACVRTAWREVSVPCKWKWQWHFVAELQTTNGSATPRDMAKKSEKYFIAAQGGTEFKQITESDSVCLPIKSDECPVKGNFSFSEEAAFNRGNYTIAMLLSDTVSGVKSYVWSTILVKAKSIATPFAQQAGGTSRSEGQSGEAAALLVGSISAAGASAYIFRRRIIQAISPKLAETISGGRFITGVARCANRVRVVATNSVKQLVGVIRNTYVSERVVARETSRQLIGIERATVQIGQPAPRSTGFGAAQFGVAWANPSAGGAQTQPRSLWDSFTGALSGLGKAISGFAHDQWNYWSSVGDSVMKGDLKGAGEKLVAGALSAGAFVVDTVKNHWKEIAVGVAIGAALVVAAPIAIPAIATALGVSAGTVTAVVTAAGVAAVGYYAASRYGPILNEINDSCDWRGATDRCAQLRSELGQNALADGAILGGSIGLGKVLSPVVGTALARRIPVEGLTDDAARETYRLATQEIGRTGGYGQYKRIVVTDGRELPELANSRGAVTPDGTLYLNKDFLADWIMHPGIFDWHETGHRAITTGLAKAEPSIVAKTNAGTAKSGPIIEVAADKVAYQLGGAKYAAGWQKYRSVLIKHYIENPPVVGIWPHEEVEIAAWLYVVHKNIGRNDIATDLMSSVVRSNSEDGVQLFNAIVAKFQRAWTKTSIAVPPDAVPASFGNSIKGARNESVCTELGRHGYGGTFAPLFWCLREWKKSTLEKAQFEKRFDYIRRLPHGYDLYRHGVKSGILIPIGKNKWKINRTRLKEIEKQSRKLKLCL